MLPGGNGYFNDEIFYLEGLMMAAKGNGKSKKTVDYGSWKGFVNVTLTDKEKTAIKAMEVTDDDLFDCLLTVIDAGHKVTITRKKDSPAAVVSFTGTDAENKNFGYTLSSFAPQLRDAVKVNFYKHHYILSGDWSSIVTGDDEDFG